MDRLAAVEVQSVMQLLDWSRCSDSRDAVGASTRTHLLTRRGGTSDCKSSSRQRTSPHSAPSFVGRWFVTHPPPRSSGRPVSPRTSRVWMLAISQQQRGIAKLQLANNFIRQITSQQWTRIMEHSAMDGLRELVIDNPESLPLGFVDQLVRLPHLHTLRLKNSLPDGETLVALPQLAHLTSLQMRDYDGTSISEAGARSRLPIVAECATNLTDLWLDRPMAYGSRFIEFFTSPNISSRLERLTLAGFCPRGHRNFNWIAPPVDDFELAFRAMTRLSHLHLMRVRYVDVMLPGVSHAPALTTLVLTSNSVHATLCSPAVLTELLSRAPNLHVSLDGPTPLPAKYVALAAANPRLHLLVEQSA